MNIFAEFKWNENVDCCCYCFSSKCLLFFPFFLSQIDEYHKKIGSLWRGRIFVDNISFPTSSNCHFSFSETKRRQEQAQANAYTLTRVYRPSFDHIIVFIFLIAHVAYEKRHRNCVNVLQRLKYQHFNHHLKWIFRLFWLWTDEHFEFVVWLVSIDRHCLLNLRKLESIWSRASVQFSTFLLEIVQFFDGHVFEPVNDVK